MDDQNEIFDVVDDNDQVVEQARRGEVHSNKNMIHRSIGVAVFDSQNRILLQKRSVLKDTDPQKWTISCSGHVGAGQSYEESAKRELKEELGIEVPIIYLCKYLGRAQNETEMTVLYKAYCDGPFTYQIAEIDEVKFFSQKELKEKVKSGEIELSFMGKKALEKIGWHAE